MRDGEETVLVVQEEEVLLGHGEDAHVVLSEEQHGEGALMEDPVHGEYADHGNRSVTHK
jgi:hypothetical protein